MAEKDAKQQSIKEKYKKLQRNGYTSIQFSQDLLKATYISLKVMDYYLATKEMHEDENILYSFLRYRMFLLLKDKFDHQKLSSTIASTLKAFVPPPDVQVFWATHIIRQQYYHDDMQNKFGILVDHYPYSRECYHEQIKLSEHLWNEEYKNDTYEPNFEKQHVQRFIESEQKKLEQELPISVGIAEAKEDLNWIKTFREHYGGATGDAYLETPFLERTIEKYKKYLFMNLKEKADGTWSLTHGPKIRVDAVWHAHQQCVNAYEVDLLREIGFIFFHQPYSEEELQLNAKNKNSNNNSSSNNDINNEQSQIEDNSPLQKGNVNSSLLYSKYSINNKSTIITPSSSNPNNNNTISPEVEQVRGVAIQHPKPVLVCVNPSPINSTLLNPNTNNINSEITPSINNLPRAASPPRMCSSHPYDDLDDDLLTISPVIMCSQRCPSPPRISDLTINNLEEQLISPIIMCSATPNTNTSPIPVPKKPYPIMCARKQSSPPKTVGRGRGSITSTLIKPTPEVSVISTLPVMCARRPPSPPPPPPCTVMCSKRPPSPPPSPPHLPRPPVMCGIGSPTGPPKLVPYTPQPPPPPPVMCAQRPPPPMCAQRPPPPIGIVKSPPSISFPPPPPVMCAQRLPSPDIHRLPVKCKRVKPKLKPLNNNTAESLDDDEKHVTTKK